MFFTMKYTNKAEQANNARPRNAKGITVPPYTLLEAFADLPSTS
jgi:hypothetical protein